MDVFYKILLILLAISAIGAAVILQHYRPQRQWQPVVLLLLGGLLLRLICAADPFLHDWDERYHALVAKHLIDAPFYPQLYPETPISFSIDNWTCNHVWLHKQPVPLWSMALSMDTFGVHEFSLRLPSVLLSTIAIGLTFLIGLWLFSYKIGFWAAFLHTLSGQIIEATGGRVATDHIDLFFMFFVELGVFFAVLEWQKVKTNSWRSRAQIILPIFMGIAVGVAILCKWLPALLVFALYVILHGLSKNTILKLTSAFLVAAAIALPWQLYAAHRFPVEYWMEQNFNTRHITEALEGHSGNFAFHFNLARIIWNELVYLPMIWLLWRVFNRRGTESPYIALACWIFVPYCFFSAVQTKMPNYLLFTGPAIFIAMAAFLFHANLTRWKYLKGVLWIAVSLLALRYCLERVKPWRNDEHLFALRENVQQLNRYAVIGDQVIVFNNKFPVETMFYTDLIAYERLPDEREMKDMVRLNYKILVMDGPNIPDSLRADARLRVISQ